MVYTKLVSTLVAIAALTGLEFYALGKGIDGALFALVVAAISGLAGYELKPLVDTLKGIIHRK